jgi:hypothetical protein
MRIGVLSDTHGDQATIRQITKLTTDVDMWLHAGDCSQDADYLASLVTVPVVAAKGNCDGPTNARLDEFVEVLGHKIWLTHGHRYGVKRGIQELMQVAKQQGIQVVIYGHTHVPDNRCCEGILFFNPGSGNCSYGGGGTYGVLDINVTQVVGSIIEKDA